MPRNSRESWAFFFIPLAMACPGCSQWTGFENELHSTHSVPVEVFAAPKCPPEALFQPLKLAPLPALTEEFVREFDLGRVENFGYVSPGVRLDLRLDLCVLNGTEVTLAQISLKTISFDGEVRREQIVIDPSDSEIAGLEDALFGDWTKVSVLVPTSRGSKLRLKALSNQGQPYAYVAEVTERGEGQLIPASSMLTVGAVELGDPFPVSGNGCPLDWERRASRIEAAGVVMDFDLCEFRALRATRYEIKTITIADPVIHLPGEVTRLSASDPDFSERVKYQVTQHNWSDTLDISLDAGTRYSFGEPSALTIVRNGTATGPVSLDCEHFFRCAVPR